MNRTHPVELLLLVALLLVEALCTLAAALVAAAAAMQAPTPDPEPAAALAAALPEVPKPESSLAPAMHPLRPLVLEPLERCTVAQLRQLARSAGLPRPLARSGRRSELVMALAGLELA